MTRSRYTRPKVSKFSWMIIDITAVFLVSCGIVGVIYCSMVLIEAL